MNVKTCVQCFGKIVYGLPPHKLLCDGHATFWCQDCIDEYAAMLWQYDDQPYPSKINRSNQNRPRIH